MKTFRQFNIKNCQNYFFNSMTNIKSLGINQISFTSTDSVVYEGVNYLYLVFNDVDACFEKNNENKYLVFALTDKNKEALENYKELWDEIKDEIETIRGIEPIKYEKDFMKIKFESDDDLPLDKILNIPVCVIIVKSVFQENGRYYPQVFLKELFYEYKHEYGKFVLFVNSLFFKQNFDPLLIQ